MTDVNKAENKAQSSAAQNVSHYMNLQWQYVCDYCRFTISVYKQRCGLWRMPGRWVAKNTRNENKAKNQRKSALKIHNSQ